MLCVAIIGWRSNKATGGAKNRPHGMLYTFGCLHRRICSWPGLAIVAKKLSAFRQSTCSRAEKSMFSGERIHPDRVHPNRNPSARALPADLTVSACGGLPLQRLSTTLSGTKVRFELMFVEIIIEQSVQTFFLKSVLQHQSGSYLQNVW